MPETEDSRPPAIVVVSKYLDAADARRLRAEGIGPCGENRAADLCDKVGPDEDADGWHFIGHLQRNKISRVIPRISLLHSLDSTRLAEAIDSWVGDHERPPCRCPVQVNVSGEGSKGGLDRRQAKQTIPEWIERFSNLRIEGLMTMPPLMAAEDCRPLFRTLRELRDEIRADLAEGPAAHFFELSMGMSGDFPAAVAEGATLVRIGRLLYE